MYAKSSTAVSRPENRPSLPGWWGGRRSRWEGPIPGLLGASSAPVPDLGGGYMGTDVKRSV